MRFSTRLDIRLEYERTFVGMTTEPVTLEKLLDARARLQLAISNKKKFDQMVRAFDDRLQQLP